VARRRMLNFEIPMAPKSPAQSNLYGQQFYEILASTANESELVVPHILDLYRAQSVIDVGCGVGSWAAAFKKNGVPEILGIDGDYVNRSLLQIDAALFRPVDLEQPLRIERKFDLAICVEVAEHLRPERADSFVADLTGLAPVIAFSAAVPGQGGTNHINEQWPDYWVERFARHGYRAFDCVRPRIWNEAGVSLWYRQNLIIYAHESRAAEFPPHTTNVLNVVHPELYMDALIYKDWPTLKHVFRALPGALSRSLQNHLKGRKFGRRYQNPASR
jgi:SAM-dependent methyltransferase